MNLFDPVYLSRWRHTNLPLILFDGSAFTPCRVENLHVFLIGVLLSLLQDSIDAILGIIGPDKQPSLFGPFYCSQYLPTAIGSRLILSDPILKINACSAQARNRTCQFIIIFCSSELAGFTETAHVKNKWSDELVQTLLFLWASKWQCILGDKRDNTCFRSCSITHVVRAYICSQETMFEKMFKYKTLVQLLLCQFRIAKKPIIYSIWSDVYSIRD